MIRFGPLQELNTRDELGPYPHALFHVRRGEPVAPAAFVCFGQIDERTLVHDQGLEPCEHLAPGGRHEAVAHLGDVDQILPVVIADDNRVHAVRAGNIAADDQLLACVQSVFGPGAAALA